MNKQNKIVVGISIGDLNGIGSEVVLKTLQDPRILDFFTPVIFASLEIMNFFKAHYHLECNLFGIDKLEAINHKKINVFNTWKESVAINFGLRESKNRIVCYKIFKCIGGSVKKQ